ncbi:virulence factor TspB C-terminal domain-related protein [Acinetobacter baumannii]|uniref:virulence factor TspB C-terminal domain-related protein n=1 Tax=Acinetobacter baumannii TaxID=470 RepID=UPI00344EB988
MAINDDLYWYKNVLRRTISTTIRFYLSLSIILSPIILMTEANATDDGDWWLQREIKLQQNREDYARRVYGRSARSFTETDPVTAKTKTVTKIAIAEASPTASKVGSSMFKRVAFYAKNPGVQMVGVMAVTQLIEAIGWVMEDGAYVKKKPADPEKADPSYEYFWSNGNGQAIKYATSIAAFNGHLAYLCSAGNWGTCPAQITSTSLSSSTATSAVYSVTRINGSTVTYTMTRFKNPLYDPNAPKPPDQIIPLTPELLGAAMMGEGYHDPVDSNIDSRVNTGLMNNSVADTYSHAGNGVGDELANDMDYQIKNAPLTPDGQPAPFGDPRYKTPPTAEKPFSNDRSWRSDGGTADGKAEPIKDADGNPTGGQSISIEFPVFCEWAFTVCKWYDDWKKTDEWMKEDPEQKDPEKVEFDEDASAGKVTLTGSDVCPQDSVQFTLMGQTYTIELPYQPVCDALTFFKPAVLAVGAITSAFIVAGINVKGED